MIRWALLVALCLPACAYLRDPPRPAELRMCLDMPLGVEFCPTVPLSWSDEPVCPCQCPEAPPEEEAPAGEQEEPEHSGGLLDGDDADGLWMLF